MTLETRFHDKYQAVPEAGCWLWTAATDANGYGKLGIGRHKTDYAHRVSWSLRNGPIPDGMWVLHKCDTPACVNPNHLFLGDQKANMADMRNKGRANDCVGERSSRAKLTKSDAAKIRSERGSHRAIAARYGIDHSQVTRIKAGKAWRA